MFGIILDDRLNSKIMKLKPSVQEIISVSNVSVIRGQKHVLKKISWSTRQDEHWFILGNNGSGKSTLLEIIMGYLWPQSGSVKVLGYQYGECFLPDVRMLFGFIAPWLIKRIRPYVPVVDVIASGENASVGFVDKISVRLRALARKEAKLFGCESLLSKQFGVLSSGEQMRVVLARAMIHQPKILIMDEPFSHLDMQARAHAYDILEKIALRTNGPQVILVTHHIQDICRMFTHGVVLREGKVAQCGSRNNILKKNELAKVLGISEKHRHLLEGTA